MRAFVHDGVRYREQPTAKERLWLPEIDLGVGIWQGAFAGFDRYWLRFFAAAGNWIPTPEERQRARTEQAEQERDAERARAEQERDAAQRYRDKLLALGIDPESV